MQTRVRARRRSIVVALVCSAMLAGVGVLPASATHQTVTAVKGSAFGYFADNISLFGGAQPDTGPTPTVTLPSGGGNQTATAATGRVAYGPAVLFTSNQIDVSTSGSLGDTGSVTSSTSINDVNTSRVEIFGEDNYDCCAANGELTPTPVSRPLTDVASTCTASTTGTSGSTTITNGWLYLDSGWTDSDAVYPEPAEPAGGLAEHDPVKIPLPVNPAPNTTYEGHIHLSATSTDNYVVVFNEQITNPDGSLTVNAVHQYFGYTLDGSGNRVVDPASTLKGDMILGQSVCGVTLGAGAHPADLGVAITDVPDPVAPVGTVTYTIDVSNNSPDAASAVTLTSSVAGGKLGTVTAPAGTTCTVSKGKTKIVTCNLGAFAAGETKTVTITAIAPRKVGTMSLTSTVSSTGDPNAANNSETESTAVVR